MNGHNFFTKKSKTVYLQGFWPKSVYLKCFGNQLKTVYLQGPHSSRPCISRPCCTTNKRNLDNSRKKIYNTTHEKKLLFIKILRDEEVV